MSATILIDTDNAMGSRFGDVDDAFALTAFLKSNVKVPGIISIFGNTDADSADLNNRALQQICGTKIPQIAGAASPRCQRSAAQMFVEQLPERVRVAALGPLTNVVKYPKDKLSEVVIVGGNSVSRGTLPPWWPNEFNLTQDRTAAARLFASDVALTVLPLNLAVTLKTTLGAIRSMPQPFTDFFSERSRLWAARSLLVRGSRAFPVWDLGAAMYMLRPELFSWEERTVRYHKRGYIRLGDSSRQIKLITGFDPDVVWQEYLGILAG